MKGSVRDLYVTISRNWRVESKEHNENPQDGYSDRASNLAHDPCEGQRKRQVNRD
jgi:hypothetical protein